MQNRKREWLCTRTNRTHVIDAELEDVWLQCLNGFQHLRVRSICEGHLNGNRLAATKSMPNLFLVVDAALNPSLIGADPAIEEQIETTFDASALRPTTEFVHAWSDNEPKEYCLYLDAKIDRTSDQMEEWVRDWFKASIVFFRHVDALVALLVPT